MLSKSVRQRQRKREKEREIEKDIEIDKRERINYQEIVDLYNNTCVSFPRVVSISENRKKAIRARLKTYCVEDLKKVFEIAEQSDFLKGKNDQNWTATFDWIFRELFKKRVAKQGCLSGQAIKNTL